MPDTDPVITDSPDAAQPAEALPDSPAATPDGDSSDQGYSPTSKDPGISSLAASLDRAMAAKSAEKAGGPPAEPAAAAPAKPARSDVAKELAEAASLPEPVEKPEAAPAPVPEPVPAAEPGAYVRKFTDEDLKPSASDRARTKDRIVELWHLKAQSDSGHELTKKELAAKAARVAELEEQVSKAASVNPEQVQKIESELMQYRRLYELENDPKVKADYDDRVAAAEQDIGTALKSIGLDAPSLALIQKMGGFAAFSRSKAQINLADGTKTTGAAMAKEWLTDMPIADARAIDGLLIGQAQTQQAKQRFINEQKASAAEYFKTQAATQGAGKVEQEKAWLAMREKVTGWHDEQIAKQPWLKDPDPLKPNATPEEKKAYEEEKALRGTLRQGLQRSIKLTAIDDVLAEKLAAVRVPFIERQLSTSQARIAQLETQIRTKDAELTKIKTAGRTTPSSGSVATPSAATTPVSRRSTVPANGGTITDVVGALEAAMDARP